LIRPTRPPEVSGLVEGGQSRQIAPRIRRLAHAGFSGRRIAGILRMIGLRRIRGVLPLVPREVDGVAEGRRRAVRRLAGLGMCASRLSRRRARTASPLGSNSLMLLPSAGRQPDIFGNVGAFSKPNLTGSKRDALGAPFHPSRDKFANRRREEFFQASPRHGKPIFSDLREADQARA
jgi:hypothetical protein